MGLAPTPAPTPAPTANRPRCGSVTGPCCSGWMRGGDAELPRLLSDVPVDGASPYTLCVAAGADTVELSEGGAGGAGGTAAVGAGGLADALPSASSVSPALLTLGALGALDHACTDSDEGLATAAARAPAGVLPMATWAGCGCRGSGSCTAAACDGALWGCFSGRGGAVWEPAASLLASRLAGGMRWCAGRSWVEPVPPPAAPEGASAPPALLWGWSLAPTPPVPPG